VLRRQVQRLRWQRDTDLTRRYIVQLGSIGTAGGGTELWFGILTDAWRDLGSLFPDLIPADDMTDDELSAIQRWIRV
jgi:hypothetical protein